MRIKILFTTFAFICTCNTHALPTPKSGFKTIRIDDGVQSHCINSSRERVTIQARSAIIQKSAPGLFTRENQALLLLKTRVHGTDAQGKQKAEEFPLLFPMSINDYAAGKVSLPIGRALVSRYPLTDSGNQYDQIEIELSILFNRTRRPLGGGLRALANVSSEMPLPINPFSDSFKYYIKFANSVVDETIKDSHDVTLTAPLAVLPLSFSSGDNCAEFQDRTGTYVVVRYEDGRESDGIVNLDHSYCWRSEFRPTESIRFAVAPPDGDCTRIPATSFTTLNNQHISFFVNAELTSPQTSHVVRSSFLYPPTSKLVTTTQYPWISDQDALNNKIAVSYHLNDNSLLNTLSSTTLAFILGKPSWKFTNISGIANDPAPIQVTGTSLDYFAGYFHESLLRCAVHGVTIDNCL